jgi:heat shock protein HslJ
MRLRFLALAAVGAVAFAGCSAIGAAQGGQLEGVTWRLSRYTSGGTSVTVPAAIGATATFASGVVSGSNGCNSYSGPYTASGSTLKVGPLMSTLMACGPAQSAVESAFMSAFQAAGSYTATSTQLTIYDTSGAQVLVFEPQATISLVGTPWNVVNYNDGKTATVGLAADSTITLEFTAEGTVTGNATCNTYNGSFTTDGDSLTVGPLATTRMACASDELNAQEALYLAALQNSATYDISNGTLTIRDAGGASQVIATPMAVQAP